MVMKSLLAQIVDGRLILPDEAPGSKSPPCRLSISSNH